MPQELDSQGQGGLLNDHSMELLDRHRFLCDGDIAQQLTAGQGGSVNPGVIMQLHVVGDEPVQILTYFVTPEDANWQTNVPNLP